MREWEVVETLDIFHFLLVGLPLILLVFEDLIGLDKGIGFVNFVHVFIVKFLVHLLPLV